MSEVAAENNLPVAEDVVLMDEQEDTQKNEVRVRKKPTGKRSNAVDIMSAEAELITKDLPSNEEVDGKRTTRSSTRVSTVASKLKTEPPAKKVKKTPSVKGGKRGRPSNKSVAKDESDDVVLAEENGISENNVNSIVEGGSSTEDEVDTKTEEKVENGNSSAEEEKDVEENKESADELEEPQPAVTEEKESSDQ